MRAQQLAHYKSSLEADAGPHHRLREPTSSGFESAHPGGFAALPARARNLAEVLLYRPRPRPVKTANLRICSCEHCHSKHASGSAGLDRFGGLHDCPRFGAAVARPVEGALSAPEKASSARQGIACRCLSALCGRSSGCSTPDPRSGEGVCDFSEFPWLQGVLFCRVLGACGAAGLQQDSFISFIRHAVSQ